MNTRLKELRKNLGLTQKEFGEKMGMQQQAIAMIENGRRSLNERQIKAICAVYGANENWIKTGEGEMFEDLTKEAEIANFMGSVLSNKSNSFKKRFIAMLSALDDDGWLLLQKMAESLIEHKDDEEN